MREPHSLWTIETATRGIEEREKTRKAEEEVKAGLDIQVQQLNKERQLFKESEKGVG